MLYITLKPVTKSDRMLPDIGLNIARDVARKVWRSLTFGGLLDDSPTSVVCETRWGRQKPILWSWNSTGCGRTSSTLSKTVAVAISLSVT